MIASWVRKGMPEFNEAAPPRPIPPPLPVLVKGEFEPSSAFQARLAQAEQDRAEAIRALERNYDRLLKQYNSAVELHNTDVKSFIEARHAAIPEKRLEFLALSLSNRLGDPVVRDLRYDADTQTFFGKIIGTSGGFSKAVSFGVPLDQAPIIKAKPDLLSPVVRIVLDGGRLLITDIRIEAFGRSYSAGLADEMKAPLAVEVRINDVPLAISDLPRASPQSADVEGLISQNRQQFASIASTIGTDPSLEELRLKEAETNRRMQEAARNQALAAEKDRLLLSIKRQEEQLSQIEFGEGGANVKEWTFRPASTASPDTIFIIIANRSYGQGLPKVRYAHNDARAMKQFAQIALRVPLENIIFELDATKGTMEGVFRSRLPNLVARSRSNVIVYYTGHGMPVGDDARLMPSDSRPDTARVSGYSRRDLLEDLASLQARSVVLILDACFTGLSADGPLLASAKPIMAKPLDPVVPDGLAVISAGQADEISWVDDQTGMSLLTLHLLEALSDTKVKSVDLNDLRDRLVETVDRHARRSWNQPQHPQILGANRTLIAY